MTIRTLATLAAFASALTASATLITHEPFDYANGQITGALNGGTGWNTGWDPQDGAGTNYAIQDASPLTFGTLLTSDSYMNGGGAFTNNGRRVGTGFLSGWDTAGRVSDPFGGGSGQGNIDQGDVWFSALVRVNAPLTSWDSARLWFHTQNIAWAPGGDADNNGLVIRSNGGGAWSVGEGNLGSSTGTSVTPAVGTTYLFVAKFELSLTPGANNAYVWIFDDPADVALGGADLATGTAMGSITGRDTTDLRFKSIGFYLDNATDRMSVDELRLGTTFASVSPVPEPSTYAAIAGALALGVIALRRRRA